MGSMYVRRSFLAAAIFALAAFTAACGGGGEEGAGGEETTGATVGGSGETLTVASDVAYRPFEFVQDGEPVGFDVDLISEIGERAGYEINLQNVVFDGVIEGVGNGLYDAGISAMTITPEREQSLAFSEPYFNADQSLLVASGSDIQTIDDIAEGTLIGAQRGTTGEALSNETAEEVGAEVRSYNTVEDAFSALENGQVDTVINDFPVSADRVQQTGDTLEIVDTIETGEQYGIAFPQESELIGPFNEALQEMKDDGTYAEIYEEWFGQEPESIP
ncbi:MAG: basic amino acid ABC transporter substrate-binding protein [Actinomycetota bacterium]|jgi:ABC-type amino acid transport substrate-binding protein|nr:basic amino acid ABC transporter substrate-binding protein [Actinomycetota bacterium]